MEIVNQYGQLIGEYSRLDQELWLTPPHNNDDDDYYYMSNSIDALDCKIMSSHLHERITDLPVSECIDDAVGDGGLTFVKNDSFSFKDSSQATSPDSVLQRRQLPINLTFVMKRARSKRCRSRKKYFRFRVYDPLFQSDGAVEHVRTRKISDLLQNPKFLPKTSLEGPHMEVSKKCLHCDSEKTRQWRDGPLGEKTLCNTCGVQYKIGLLDANDPPCRSPKLDTSLSKIPKNIKEAKRAKNKVPKDYNNKCQHCETSRTPQWRPGPMGHNSLCNACWVQYKNGRLFPEYRPRNSPTYDPSLHSHMATKFQKMRTSKISEEEKQAMP